MEEFWRRIGHFVSAEWRDVKRVPLTLVVVAIVAFAGGYGVARWHYKERIAVLETRLGNSTPTLAPASSLGSGRHLTDAEKQRIADHMPPPTEGDEAIRTIWITRCGGLKCLAFADDLRDALGRNGWHAMEEDRLDIRRPPSGVQVQYASGGSTALKTEAEAVAAALSNVPIAAAHAVPNDELSSPEVIVVVVAPEAD